MATDIIIPAVGESITEGVISAWLKQDGEYVHLDEDIVELETDKVTLEVPSPASGVLGEALVKEGDVVEVDALLGTVEAGSAAAAPTPAVEAKAETKSSASEEGQHRSLGTKCG